MMRFLVALLMAFLAPLAHASFPATSSGSTTGVSIVYTQANGAGSYLGFSLNEAGRDAACPVRWGSGATWEFGNGCYRNGSYLGGLFTSPPLWCWNGVNGSVVTSPPCQLTYTCPANATLNGTTCTCAPDTMEVNEGGVYSCTPNPCEAGQTQTKIVNVGWARALARSDGATWKTSDGRDFFGPLPGAVMPSDVAVPSSMCDGSCSWSGGAAKSDYWISMNPGATGLHPIYREVEYTNTGSQCSTPSPIEADPSQQPPPCDGFMGTVQGKLTCIAKQAPTGISGQADKGAKGTNSGAGSAPQAESGGGVGPNGEKPPAPGDRPSLQDLGGTGKSVQGSTGTGTVIRSDGTTSTVTFDIKACGGEGQPACKIDESGTPDGKNAYEGSNAELKGAWDRMDAALSAVTNKTDKDTSWVMPSWISAGACAPWNLGTFPVIDKAIVIDMCQHKPVIDAVMNFVWVIFTFFAVLAMVERVTMGPGKA